VLVSSRNFSPFFFTPLERGRNLIPGSETVRTFVPFDCPIQRSHPVVQSNAPIQWSNPPFPSSGPTHRSHPVVGTHPRCVLIRGPGITRTGEPHWIGQPNVPIRWSNPTFPSSCRDAPKVRPNTRTGNYEDREIPLDWTMSFD
jgi:hypothetical protein